MLNVSQFEVDGRDVSSVCTLCLKKRPTFDLL